jgi:predicted negative regulator of RcsB-dependent stress response
MDKEANHGGDIYTLVAWANTNRKQLTWALVVVLAVGLCVGLYYAHKSSREAQANEAFCAIKMPVPGRDAPTTAVAAQFAQVADSYPDTSAGTHAMLLAGGIYYGAGEFEQARVLFQRLLAEHGDYPLANAAAVGVAASLEAEGKIAEATARYEDLVHRNTMDSTWPQSRFALARLYTQQNHPDRAFQLYEEMLQARSGDSWTLEARPLAAELLSKYPALRQQGATPSAAPAPVPAASAPVLDVPKP